MAKRARFFAGFHPSQEELIGEDTYLFSDNDEFKKTSRSQSMSQKLFGSKKKKRFSLAQTANLESLHSHDRTLRIRNVFMSLNTVLSLLLLVLMFQLEWDGSKWTETTDSFRIKLVISILTVILVCQVCEYYYQMISFQIRNTINQHALNNPSSNKNNNNNTVNTELEYPLQSRKPPSETSPLKRKTAVPRPTIRTILRTTTIARRFLVELLFILPHPLPVSSGDMNKFGLFMFLRLYIFLKVIRDFNIYYQKRKNIERINDVHTANPTFNTMLTMKILFFQYPIHTVVLFIITSGFVLGYCLYIFEREPSPDLFTYINSVALIWQIMVSGWGTDTYEVYIPVTFGGKLISQSAVVVGLFLFALLIDYVHNRMQLTNWQMTTLNAINRSQARSEQREEAAKLIQIAWQYYQWRTKMQKAASNNRAVDHIEHQFALKFLKQIKICKRVRNSRNRTALVERTSGHDAQMRAYVKEFASEIRTSILRDLNVILDEQRRQILRDLRSPQSTSYASESDSSLNPFQ